MRERTVVQTFRGLELGVHTSVNAARTSACATLLVEQRGRQLQCGIESNVKQHGRRVQCGMKSDGKRGCGAA